MLRVVEQKLKQIDPSSRALRKDTPVLKKDTMAKSERLDLDNEINEFVKSIPDLAKEIAKNSINDDIAAASSNSNLPPIRVSKEHTGIKGTHVEGNVEIKVG